MLKKTPNNLTKLIDYQYDSLLNIFVLVTYKTFNTSCNHEVGWESIKDSDLAQTSGYTTMNSLYIVK